jgi:hypothetical protein
LIWAGILPACCVVVGAGWLAAPSQASPNHHLFLGWYGYMVPIPDSWLRQNQIMMYEV